MSILKKIANFYEKKSLSQMIENCLLWREKAKKFGGKRRFSAGAAVPPPFLHSSILFFTKATAVPNFKAETLLWTEIMHVLLLVSKSVTSTSPFSKDLSYHCIIIY